MKIIKYPFKRGEYICHECGAVILIEVGDEIEVLKNSTTQISNKYFVSCPVCEGAIFLEREAQQ